MINLSKLDSTCMSVAAVFQSVMNGTISVMDNRNARAIGPRFVAEQIGASVNNVGMKAMMRQPVSVEEVSELADTLESIADSFGVEALREPIEALRNLIQEEQTGNDTE